MPTHPPSSQPYNGPHRRFGHLPSPLFALRTPPRDVQLEGDGVLSHDVPSHDKPESPPPDIDCPPTMGRNVLIDLAGRLRLSLPPSSRWFGPGDLRVIVTRLVDAGGFADLWVGEMVGRKVAIKSYRCYLSGSCMPIYKRFSHEALACTRLSDNKSVVPFIGVYSTPEHPFALVFEFMEHLNLKEYIRKRDAGKLELLLGIARAVKDMHSINVVHGNLGITNILVDAGGRIRLAGLGAVSIPSTMPGVDVDRISYGAVPESIDPQCFAFVGTESAMANDVYAFGIIAWEVFAGRVLFSDRNKAAEVYSIVKGRHPGRPDHPELSNCSWKLIKGCWKSDPARRKTMAEVVGVLEAELNKVE